MDLLKANVKQLYFKYLLPSLGSAVAISIYSFVDSIAVGQSEGPDGAAVMAVFSPLYGATVCLGILCGMGGSVLMSKAKGEGNEEKGNAYFTSALVLLSLLTVAFWAASAFFYETIFMWFGADRDLIPLVMKYAKWILMFCPCFLFSIFLACFIRNDNAPGLALCAVVTGGVFNIFGDWFLVFPLGMGIEGAAIATVIGTGIQTLVLCSYFFSKKCGLKLVKPYRLFRAFKKIFATGFGSSLLDFANVILVCIFNNQIMHYGGRQELSIFGVVATISALFQALYSGIGQAAQPLISMNFGAGNHSRIRQTFRLAMITSVVLNVVFTVTGLFFPIQITRLFMAATPEVLKLAPNIMRTYFLTFLCMGVTVLSIYYLQSMMRAKLSMTIALLRGFVVSGLLLYMLPLIMGMSGVWWAMPISEGVVAVIALSHIKHMRVTCV